MKNINSEDPRIHWEYVNVKDRVVLDLGCGDFGRINQLDYPSTIDYFISKGAKQIIGVDYNSGDTAKISDKLGDKQVIIINMIIEKISDIESLLSENHIDVVKCDIEGAEIHLFSLNNDVFSKVKEYYIETHSAELYSMCINKLAKCNYEIVEQLNLEQTGESCKVIFAKK